MSVTCSKEVSDGLPGVSAFPHGLSCHGQTRGHLNNTQRTEKQSTMFLSFKDLFIAVLKRAKNDCDGALNPIEHLAR